MLFVWVPSKIVETDGLKFICILIDLITSRVALIFLYPFNLSYLVQVIKIYLTIKKNEKKNIIDHHLVSKRFFNFRSFRHRLE